MTFFSGFGFANEQLMLDEWLDKSRFSIAGFSMGAIDAVEYALTSQNRIDKIQLFSPAFFNDMTDEKRLSELKIFEENQNLWLKVFYKKCCCDADYRNIQNINIDNLNKLLSYKWDINKLQKLVGKGIAIDVFVGLKDQIINANSVVEFFLPHIRQIFKFKNFGHCLK